MVLALVVVSMMVFVAKYCLRTFNEGICASNITIWDTGGQTRIRNEESTQADLNEPTSWSILLAINAGYFDFFQNWLWHFRRLHLNIPVIVIAEDDSSFQKLKLLDTTSVTIERSCANNSEGAVNVRTEKFKKLVSERPSHILRHLQLGRNVVYGDTDSVWLRNPFPYFIGDYDIWAQLDEDKFCTGFLAIKVNNRTIKLMEKWKVYIDRRSPLHDQIAFNKLKMSGVRIKGLDTDYFPAGFQYFSHDDFNEENRGKVVVVHNNYIISHDRKLERFKKFNLWNDK